jgi:4-amino-4-deoxy-L-arabinose transferase-like glycosyltransferase
MLYAMLSVAGLYLAEKLVRRSAGWFASVSAGLVCGLAFLTRTSGITLVLAVAVYLMIRRAWKPALVSFSVALVFVIGWTMWVSFNRTTIQGVNVAFYTNYFKDVREIHWQPANFKQCI